MREYFEVTGKRVVALCIAHICGEYEHKIYQAVTTALKAAGFEALVFCAYDNLFRQDEYCDGEAAIYSLIPYDSLSGIIIATQSLKDNKYAPKIAAKANEAGIPVVSIDGQLPGCSNVLFDYSESMEAIVRHVVEDHGCKKVNFIAGIKGNSFSDERIESYKKVLAENNIPFEEKRLGYGDFWEDPARKVMKRFLSDSTLPDAIICANDSMAIAACGVLTSMGYSVPDDVIVTGLDGIDAERFHTPRLTTACANYSGAAKIAVQVIKEFTDEGVLTQKDYVVKHSVIHSQSCGCVKKSVTNANEKVLALYSQMLSTNEFHEIMGRMVTAVSACKDVTLATDKTARYVQFLKLPNISFYSCANFLGTDVEKTNKQTFSEISNIIIEYQNSQRIFEDVSFKTQAIMPNPDEMFAAGLPVLVLPIHFKSTVLGHMVAPIPRDYNKFTELQIFHSNYNHLLELLHTQFHLKKALSDLQIVFIHDYLTSLYNRRGFYTLINNMIEEAKRQQQSIAVFSIDLNGLKYLNDTFGHQEGDYAIKTVADALEKCAPKSAICARFGGDEFSVAMICSNPQLETEAYLQRVQSFIDQINASDAKPYDVSASFGCSYKVPDDNFYIDDLIRDADDKMYDKKKNHPLHRSGDRR